MSDLTQLIKDIVTEDSVARKVANAAKVNKRLGAISATAEAAEEAAGTVAEGIFTSPGVISSIYLDHGTGQNRLNYNDVDLSGKPRDTWVYNGASFSDAELVDNSGDVDADVLQISSTVGTYSAWVPLTLPSQTHTTGRDYIASIYYYGDNADALGSDMQLRVKCYGSEANALSDTSVLETFTLTPADTVMGTEIDRVGLLFNPASGSDFLRFEVRAKRNGGAAGTLPAGSFYQPMLEEVTEGQTQPSKFTLPIPRRGGLPVSLLEGNAFRTYISGLEIARESNSSISISAGQCFVPGRSQLISSDSIVIASLTVGTGPFVRYVYAGVDAAGDFEITIGSAAPVLYAGTAKVQTGDDTKRFVGTIIVYDNKVPQHKREGEYFYFTDGVESTNGITGLPWREVLTSGNSTAGSVVSLAGLVPVHANSVDLYMRLKQPGGAGQTFTTGRVGHPALPGNLGAAISAGLGESTMNVAIGPVASDRAAVRGVVRTDNSASQNINYAVSSPTSPTATLDIDVMGWYEQR